MRRSKSTSIGPSGTFDCFRARDRSGPPEPERRRGGLRSRPTTSRPVPGAGSTPIQHVPALRTLALLASLLGAAWALPAPPASAQAPLPRVTVTAATREPVVEEVPVTGTVVSPQTSSISPEVEGRVAEMRVEVGDRVEAGAVLAVLDKELAGLDLARAQAAAREAREALSDARRRLEEAERLSAGDAYSESALLSLRSEVQTDAAALERLDVEERRARALLERYDVRAPFAGAISHRMANAGEWVSPGSELLELVATDALRIDFQVPQAYFPRVDAESRIEVALDAAPAQRLAGRVVRTVPRSDTTLRTFLMLVVLEDASAPAIPGMSARARLRVSSGRDGVVVPRDALLRHPDGRVTVFVLAPDAERPSDAGPPTEAQVVERRVDTGRAFDGRVEIVEGLEAGRFVVVLGNEGLRDGQRVRVRVRPADV